MPRSENIVPRGISAVVLCAALCGCETDQIDPMERQPKYLPYSQSILFSDGRAMRPLVEGTVPRERFIGDAAIRTGFAEGGDYLDHVPIPVNREFIERGHARYDITCGPCHGLLGNGSSIVASKMSLRPPPSLIKNKAVPGRLFQIISQGYGLMPSYAAELSLEERWAAVAYLQALKMSQNAPLDRAPPEVQQRLLEQRP